MKKEAYINEREGRRLTGMEMGFSAIEESSNLLLCSLCFLKRSKRLSVVAVTYSY